MTSSISHHEEEEEDDDEQPYELPADTLAALAEFRQEQSAMEKRFEDLKSQAEERFEGQQLTMDVFGEDWNQSQFWYTDDTANILARELLADITEESAIAVVSAPSVYVALKNMLRGNEYKTKPRLLLLEYDPRFEVFKDEFQIYDFANPLRLPSALKASFDRIICDPPFLQDDCQSKTALTVRFLARDWSQHGVRFVSCTGERMEQSIHRLYETIGVRTTSFEPE